MKIKSIDTFFQAVHASQHWVNMWCWGSLTVKHEASVEAIKIQDTVSIAIRSFLKKTSSQVLLCMTSQSILVLEPVKCHEIMSAYCSTGFLSLDQFMSMRIEVTHWHFSTPWGDGRLRTSKLAWADASFFAWLTSRVAVSWPKIVP